MKKPLPSVPPGFPGGYVPIIGTVGEGGRVTLAKPKPRHGR